MYFLDYQCSSNGCSWWWKQRGIGRDASSSSCVSGWMDAFPMKYLLLCAGVQCGAGFRFLHSYQEWAPWSWRPAGDWDLPLGAIVWIMQRFPCWKEALGIPKVMDQYSESVAIHIWVRALYSGESSGKEGMDAHSESLPLVLGSYSPAQMNVLHFKKTWTLKCVNG